MDESLTATIRGAMPLAAHLGIEAVEGGRATVVLRGAWAAEHCTAAGVLHGGYLMTLADAAAATLAYLNLPSGATTATIEAKTNFLAAVREGAVTARAWAAEHCTAARKFVFASIVAVVAPLGRFRYASVAAVREGAVTARAELVHAGKRTIVVQVDITADDGRLVSRTLQTQAVIGA